MTSTSDQLGSADKAELTPFQRFEAFARRLIAVPRREIDEQEAKAGKS
jgi:hypothetical protein